ncbi:SDR family NAD(P)-dependent oxidoreductase [Microbacterium sp. A196]|uniref:SDR family NAD(P)-dependent oxidoreductase n=1 Tax=Microbacterium sp. A196 TaxID=3457320 RepID=UPI003FD60B9B
MKVDGKLVLVTGAAKGIGHAIATAFAEAGAQVILTDLAAGAVDQAARELRDRGLDAHSRHLGVTDRAGLDALASQIATELGDIDVLVNNAGIAGYADVGAEDSPGIWDSTIDVDLTGVFNVTRAFLDSLTRTRGAVVNISSVCAFTSGFSHVSYTAAKGGVSALTRAMCREFAALGVRVNAVAPGWIKTEAVDQSDADHDRFVHWHVPFDRFGTPAEIAAPVVFLASDAASFISGVTLPVDGGYLTV